MKATINKLSESGKSALVLVKTSAFSMPTPVYIPNNEYQKGQEIEIPEGLQIINWGDRTSKTGAPLKCFA